jgi:hypothetical protein
MARQLLDTPDYVPTVEGILESTGLSRGTFYNYFANVDECIVVPLCILHRVAVSAGSSRW